MTCCEIDKQTAKQSINQRVHYLYRSSYLVEKSVGIESVNYGMG